MFYKIWEVLVNLSNWVFEIIHELHCFSSLPSHVLEFVMVWRRKVSPRVRHLNTQDTLEDAISEDLGDVTLLEEMCHGGGLWEHIALPFSQLILTI